MALRGRLIAIVAGTILMVLAVVIYKNAFSGLGGDVATQLSSIVLIGLGLTVILMAVLAIVYATLGVENKDQPLALPEGSIRALLAFSLVLIFVCLGAFLFSEVNNSTNKTPGVTLERVTDAQLADLKANFTVAAGYARDQNGNTLYEKIKDPRDNSGNTTIDDLKHPLYRAIYYPKKNADATEFAKQIFTTLATVFVSVVSFYFGSSVTASAVKAGSNAAQGPDPGSQQKALSNALADSHNAQMAVDAATARLTQAKALPESDPSRPAAISTAQAALDAAKASLQDAQTKVKAAQGTMNAKKANS